MKRRLLSLLVYSLFWLSVFILGRMIFLLLQYEAASRESFSGIAGTFVNGAKLDISTTGYYMLLPVLLSVPALFIRGRWHGVFMKWYTFLMIVFSAFIIIADANLYSYWGYRMDYTPVLYLRTPKEAMASVSTLKIILFVLSVVILSLILVFAYIRLVKKYFENPGAVRNRLTGSLIILLLWASLIIPIRGGFGIAPINAGSVYFSNRMFLNHAAVNVVWNVGTSAFTRKPVSNPYNFTDQEKAASVFETLQPHEGGTLKVLNTERPNVLMIVLESFSGYLVGPLGGDSLVTPFLNRYAREGILFSGFYASGTRTDKAMPAILDGYPAQPAQSIIKEPKKTQSLPSIVRLLAENGYHAAFWYGGEINFANFKSFVIGSGFRTIITKDYFDPADYNSKWGVHDHVMFNSLRDSMSSINEPFFNVVLTLSSHEPFDVPMKPVFSGSDNLTLYRNSVYYSDHALGEFIEWAREQHWWKNTLVILVADHGAWEKKEIPAYYEEFFRIPMVWMGGAVATGGLEIKKLGSQTDICMTLLNQLGIKGDFPFSKDLFSSGSPSYAFYTFNEGFGFLTDSSVVAWDHKVMKPVRSVGRNADPALENGKAYLQVLFDDYLKR